MMSDSPESQSPNTPYPSQDKNRTAPTAGDRLHTEEMVLNMGPQHPSTHGVLRLEMITDGELVRAVIPHLGYMHRCFEKHAESLSYSQIIPFTDRIDYLAAMNCEHAFVMGVERMLGMVDEIPRRTEFIRVLVCELNRIASHLLAIGTFGIDLGAITAFLWCLRDREHILNLLEWASGARLLYNYIWVGGLFYELPLQFETRTREFLEYFAPRVDELDNLVSENTIFVARTAEVGILPLDTALNYGVSGPTLRGSGLAYDLRRVEGYSVYPELEFEVPTGQGLKGQQGDCWDRYKVRVDEIRESIRILHQCLEHLVKDCPRSREFDPRESCPARIRPEVEEYYIRAENPRGEMGYYFISQPKKDIPFRCKARGASFSNLSVLPELTQNVLLADIVAILGSIDIVLCDVDR